MEAAVDRTVAIVVDDVEGLSRRRVEAVEQGHVEGCSSQVDVPADFELIGMVVASDNRGIELTASGGRLQSITSRE